MSMIIFFIKSSFILIGRFIASFHCYLSICSLCSIRNDKLQFVLFLHFVSPHHNQLPCRNSINFPGQTYFQISCTDHLQKIEKCTSKESNQRRAWSNNINTSICCHSSFQCPLSSAFSIIHSVKLLLSSAFTRYMLTLELSCKEATF